MSKTIRLSDLIDNPEAAKVRVQQHARQQARFHVINAKRALAGKPVAYVDGRLVDGGVDARSDLKVSA